MDNQHRKIKGYRELSQKEINLMNRIKAAGNEILKLESELATSLRARHHALCVEWEESGDPEKQEELTRFEKAEPLRWSAIGKKDIQTGIMALVRAVAQPGEGS